MSSIFVNDQEVDVVNISCLETISSIAHDDEREDKSDAFIVVELGDIVNKLMLWSNQLPRVEPHYAIKCNDNPVILGLLAQLGIGFDCASKTEIQRILELNVSPKRVVYANPCKQYSHIEYAAQNGVAMMTFDNEMELHKVKTAHPNAKLIVRILPPDESKSEIPFGSKFGAHPENIPHLLKVAKGLDLDVIGVSFHVGSRCNDAIAYTGAVSSARKVFEMGKEAGYSFDLLDIGGGFPGESASSITFEQFCCALRLALDKHFPDSMGVRIISEPGRFFVASALTLATNIIAKRSICRTADHNNVKLKDDPEFMYYINDGVYGALNCVLTDHAIVEPVLLVENGNKRSYTSSIWGPTCDAQDCVKEVCLLPELEIGDWVIFKNMGAYTTCLATTFNGMAVPQCHYTITEDALYLMKSTSRIKKLPMSDSQFFKG